VASALANALAQELVDRWADVSGGQSVTTLGPLQGEIGQIRDEVSAVDERIALLDARIVPGSRSPQMEELEAKRDALARRRDGLDQQRLLLESQLNQLLVDGASRSAPEVIDPAVAPEQSDPKHEVSTAALGGFLGFLVGICVAALVESLRPTLAGSEAIADVLGVPVLGKMRADARASAAEIQGPALKARLAAAGVNAKTVELVSVGPPIDLSPLSEAMMDLEPVVDHGRPPLVGANGRLAVHRFGIEPDGSSRTNGSTAGAQSALVAVLPSTIKRTDLRELIDLQEVTSWPLVGVVTYDRRSRARPGLRPIVRPRRAGAGKLGLSQRAG
jgi:hypothetical protein